MDSHLGKNRTIIRIMSSRKEVSTYSRKEAIEDGVLVDVSTVAEETGIKYPVAITQAVWGKYVEVPPGVIGQDVEERLWNILYMLKMAAKASKGEAETLYKLHVRNDNREGVPPLVTLKAICGPGDDGEPVITIMMPDED